MIELLPFLKNSDFQFKFEGTDSSFEERLNFYSQLYAKRYDEWPSEGNAIIRRGKQELLIICDHCKAGLFCYFEKNLVDKEIADFVKIHPSDYDGEMYLREEKMEDFIKSHPDEAFEMAIFKVDDHRFVLNIAPCYDLWAMDETSDEYTKFIRERTLLFQPIIEKFLDEGVVE
ncbi:MAG: hypothetical protein II683_07095 [Muribaculaceae bacterium]|nr:hypothetical protein [Muribaculaceae bacterium]